MFFVRGELRDFPVIKSIPSLRRTAPSAEARSEFLALLKRPGEHVLPTWIYHGTIHCYICIYIYM